jgi:hypothetical protein
MGLISAVVLTLVAGQNRDIQQMLDGSLWKNTIGLERPSGKNGLEEIVWAVHILERDQVDKKLLPHYGPDGLVEPSPDPSSIVRLTDEAASWIEAGVRKDWVFDIGGYETLMPHLSKTKMLAKVLSQRTAAQFELGLPREAGRTIRVSFALGVRQGHGSSLIQYLVGTAITNIAIADCESGLRRLPVSELHALINTCEEALANPAIIETIRSETELTASGIIKLLNEGSNEGIKQFLDIDSLGKMTKQQQEQAVREFGAAVRSMAAMQIKIVQTLPEKQWAIEAAKIGLPKTTSPGARTLVNVLTPSYSAFLRSAAIRRTYFRVLRLSAKVRLWELDNGRLPETLVEAVGKKDAFDPHAGESFVYVKESGGFRIFSTADSKGEIGLKFRSYDRGGE